MDRLGTCIGRKKDIVGSPHFKMLRELVGSVAERCVRSGSAIWAPNNLLQPSDRIWIGSTWKALKPAAGSSVSGAPAPPFNTPSWSSEIPALTQPGYGAVLH
jgi:hypothetical protein